MILMDPCKLIRDAYYVAMLIIFNLVSQQHILHTLNITVKTELFGGRYISSFASF